jgi:hypothetical protein
MNTLNSTFDLFFSDKPAARVCTDCCRDDSEDSKLEVLYTFENGDQVWICPACKAKRDEASKARAEAEAERVREMTWRDEWEEG